LEKITADHPECRRMVSETNDSIKRLLSVNGRRTVDSFHKELGKIMWDYCGMSRNVKGLEYALEKIPQLRAEFWENVQVLGEGAEFNQTLEKAGRVADFLEFGELVCRDALARAESCGGHFREEYQTEEGEALRDDTRFAHAAVWEHTGPETLPIRHEEPLAFEYVHLTQRSYK
jgi:succinate dehydrogenase / fumarate reductase flavoprotein subunit